MNKKPTPRPCIAALGEYPMGAPVEDSSLVVSNLDNNEHWSGPSNAVKLAVSEAIGKANLYPEGSAYVLRQEIAAVHGLDSALITCGNGSSELIAMLCRIFCAEGDNVVVGSYSYMYFRTAAQIVGAEVIMPPGNNIELDIDELSECVNDRTRIVFLDNPQNPIGNVLSASKVRKFHASLRPNVLLVLDAAYAEYVDGADYEDGTKLVEEFSNCVTLRTFSKIYGLAALRLGWSYAPREISDLLNSVRQPNNLSSLSVVAARAALSEQKGTVAKLDMNRVWRKQLVQDMETKLGMHTYPSHTNFVLGHLPENCPFDAAGVDQILREQGVLIRSMVGYGLPNHLRVTVCEPNHINRFIVSMEDLLK